MTFILTSPAFRDGGAIPSEYTCDGSDHAPPLVWTHPPHGTVSLALIVDDPDAPDPAAPKTRWVHWVVYNLPPRPLTLPQAGGRPEGAVEGPNDWGQVGYRGPCPPVGRHRYVHTLFALDTSIRSDRALTASALRGAMEGHVLASAQLIGVYARAS